MASVWLSSSLHKASGVGQTETFYVNSLCESLFCEPASHFPPSQGGCSPLVVGDAWPTSSHFSTHIRTPVSYITMVPLPTEQPMLGSFTTPHLPNRGHGQLSLHLELRSSAGCRCRIVFKVSVRDDHVAAHICLKDHSSDAIVPRPYSERVVQHNWRAEPNLDLPESTRVTAGQNIQEDMATMTKGTQTMQDGLIKPPEFCRFRVDM